MTMAERNADITRQFYFLEDKCYPTKDEGTFDLTKSVKQRKYRCRM